MQSWRFGQKRSRVLYGYDKRIWFDFNCQAPQLHGWPSLSSRPAKWSHNNVREVPNQAWLGYMECGTEWLPEVGQYRSWFSMYRTIRSLDGNTAVLFDIKLVPPTWTRTKMSPLQFPLSYVSNQLYALVVVYTLLSCTVPELPKTILYNTLSSRSMWLLLIYCEISAVNSWLNLTATNIWCGSIYCHENLIPSRRHSYVLSH